MLSLFNPTLWLVALALFAGSSYLSYLEGRSDGRKAYEIEYTSKAIQAANETRRLENLRQSRVNQASQIASAREARLRTDLAGARGESAGLRDDLAVARDYAKQSRAAAERTANLATELLGRCEARYLGMAEAAQRADIEARELREAWPR